MVAIGGYGNIFSVGTNGTNYQNVLSFTGTGGTASGDMAVRQLDAQRHYALRQRRRTAASMATDAATSSALELTVRISGPVRFHRRHRRRLPARRFAAQRRHAVWDDFRGRHCTRRKRVGTVFALTLPTPYPEPGTLALVGTGSGCWRFRIAGGGGGRAVEIDARPRVHSGLNDKDVRARVGRLRQGRP